MRAIAIALTLTGIMFAAASPAAAASFDGAWSVLIVTEKGDCDRAYRYEVSVSDGQVRYRGSGSVKVSGTVSPQGAVRVRIMVGENAAQANGRLTGNGGVGTWQGAGIDDVCTGRWEAEKK